MSMNTPKQASLSNGLPSLAELVPAVVALAEAAGADIMAIYNAGPTAVMHKADDSPLTAADLAAHVRIVAGLQQLTPDIPVVSEEGCVPDEGARTAPVFWLVDPLDGTKEFVARNGEFTVNIALIEQGRPVLGVVTVPAQNVSYWGSVGAGAYRRQAGETQAQRLYVAVPREAGRPLRVMASKHHFHEDTRALIARMGAHELVQAGSSLKFCRIAEGAADVYPRLGPTCEWDTAAAQAVVEAAGGHVCTLQGEPLRYGKAEVLNPDFVVSAVPLAALLTD
ncbi:3'(2'),5'-bisphosphate nucleotidase CysQ [Aquabacterium sp.]|uniref:3'(2'),5'-bisphosphate nucleotidase CysQ n=1 Tax=Aquabacterium sp. TaxID=1872578 RepID=UPI003BAF1DDC